jgi:transaldolase
VTDHYFDRIRAATGTRFWVNNPTLEEIDLALSHGAMGCTTNPAYGGGLVKRAPAEVLPIIRASLGESDDDEVVATIVQERLVARICDRFLPLYEASAGREGFVSIQGSPEADVDASAVLEEARRGRAIAPNATPKIPATGPGLVAFEQIVAEGSQVIVTEVFSLAQLIEVCERWLAVTARTGVRPPFMMSPITGILGDHLRDVAERDGLDVPAEAIVSAGVILSRACYRTVRDRGYPVLLLYGGARGPFDLTGLVGGGMAATINWSTADELLQANNPIVATVEDPVDPTIERILVESFPEMRQALVPDGLAVEAFEDFGPVQYFRDRFIAGWDAVRAAISEARQGAQPQGAQR